MFIAKRAWSLLWVVMVSASLFAGSASAATSDSFFDIWLELWDDPVLLDLTNGPTLYQSIPTEMVSLSLTSSRAPVVVDDPSTGSFIIDSFFDIDYSTTDGGSTTVDVFFDVEVRMSFTLTDSSNDHRSWDTEMLSMDLRSSPPHGDSLTRPAVSSSPSLRHHGHVTILKLAGPGGGGGGGTFSVDSFFDVWTEMSVDGGGSYDPATGASNVSFNTLVPEPGTGALLGLGLAALAVRRRARA